MPPAARRIGRPCGRPSGTATEFLRAPRGKTSAPQTWHPFVPGTNGVSGSWRTDCERRENSMSLRASRFPSSHAPPVPRPRRRTTLVAWMLAAIALVTALAWWDERREAEAALHDLETEQSTLATSLASSLRAHLASVESDATLIGEHGRAGF